MELPLLPSPLNTSSSLVVGLAQHLQAILMAVAAAGPVGIAQV
jgi:hypothetical protein